MKSHVAESKTISQVSRMPASNSEHAPGLIIVSRRAHEVIENGDHGEHRQNDEKPATKQTAFLQLTKRDAGVLGVHELKKAREATRSSPNHSAPYQPTPSTPDVAEVNAEGSQ